MLTNIKRTRLKRKLYLDIILNTKLKGCKVQDYDLLRGAVYDYIEYIAPKYQKETPMKEILSCIKTN